MRAESLGVESSGPCVEDIVRTVDPRPLGTHVRCVLRLWGCSRKKQDRTLRNFFVELACFMIDDFVRYCCIHHIILNRQIDRQTLYVFLDGTCRKAPHTVACRPAAREERDANTPCSRCAEAQRDFD